MALTMFGTGVAPGIAIGKAHLAARNRLDITEQQIADEQINHEVKRFRRAVRSAQQELAEIRAKIPSGTPAEILEFVDAHVLMMQDDMLTEAPVEIIREQHCNAEWALQTQRDRLAQAFSEMDDPYLASRIQDVDQVVSRILRVLQTGKNDRDADAAHMTGMILVADDLAPADLTLLHHEGIAGLITEHGGPLSHTAILARSLGIPTAMGLRNTRRLFSEGEEVIVDGDRGVVIALAGQEVARHYKRRHKAQTKAKRQLRELRNKKSVTRDGQSVGLHANVDLPEDFTLLEDFGADGVGLVRTEFLFMNRDGTPDEEEQFAVYKTMAENADGRPVTIRTLDLGADKQLPGANPHHAGPNPALGLRAIRLCLNDHRLFIPQLRAIIRASQFGNIRILLPMLTNSQELFQALNLVDQVRRELQRGGVKTADRIPVGGMIEVPAAALATRTFAKNLDFLSIGTNDLIQYTLAIDRIDDQVGYLYDPVHPAVLRLLRWVIKEADAVDTPVAMCGEMAGDSNFTRMLLAMGLREFSMQPASLPAVKQVVLNTDLDNLESVSRRLFRASNPLRIAKLIRELNQQD